MPVRRSFLAQHLAVRCLLAGWCLLLPFAVSGQAQTAAPKPVTVPELSLLLHGGYTGDEVLRETAGRPLIQPLDAASEKALRDAGGDQRFIDALKSGRTALNGAQAAAARQQQTASDNLTAEGRAAYASRLMDANKQAFEVHQSVRKQEALGKLAQDLKGMLSVFRDGRLQPLPDAALDSKKMFAFYFSNATQAPCRKFTPLLVKFYQDFAPKHPAFEVVHISLDRSPYMLENALRQDNIPWPVLAYDQRAQQPGIMQQAGQNLPALVIVDGMGRMVASSTVEGKYVGPEHVLDELKKLATAGGE